MDGDDAGHRAGLLLADRAARMGWVVETISAPPGLDFNEVRRQEKQCLYMSMNASHAMKNSRSAKAFQKTRSRSALPAAEN